MFIDRPLGDIASDVEIAHRPLLADGVDYGFVGCNDSSGDLVVVGYHGGGTAEVPRGSLRYPTPGVTGWFD